MASNTLKDEALPWTIVSPAKGEPLQPTIAAIGRKIADLEKTFDFEPYKDEMTKLAKLLNERMEKLVKLAELLEVPAMATCMWTDKASREEYPLYDLRRAIQGLGSNSSGKAHQTGVVFSEFRDNRKKHVELLSEESHGDTAAEDYRSEVESLIELVSGDAKHLVALPESLERAFIEYKELLAKYAKDWRVEFSTSDLKDDASTHLELESRIKALKDNLKPSSQQCPILLSRHVSVSRLHASIFH